MTENPEQHFEPDPAPQFKMEPEARCSVDAYPYS